MVRGHYMDSQSRKKLFAIVLLSINLLSLWLWWESYSDTVNWEMRKNSFPMPFYVLWIPNWFIVDLAITLLITSSIMSCYLIIDKDQKADSNG